MSWVLYGIAQNPFLKENLVFKGSALLKKAYFPKFRFSEHLDFMFKGDLDIDAIRAAFSELVRSVQEASKITLSLKKDQQQAAGNFNFHISYTGPLGASTSGKDLKINITKEEICNAPELKEIMNEYSDLANEKYSLLCHTLDDVSAEKMCLLMQRTAPGDLYDIWYLFEMDGYDIKDCVYTFQEKALLKNLDPKKFTTTIEKKWEKMAKQWNELAPQMTTLRDFSRVWRELAKHWRSFQEFIER
jgi:predicted nucleotidyltransferase component of viral defense system